MLKKEYKFLLVLLLITGIFFYQFLLLGKIPFPGDLLVGGYNPWRSYSFLGYAPGGIPNKAQYFDAIRQIYPWKNLVINSFGKLQIPLWNPYNFSGYPLMANNQSAVWYPLNLLYLIFSQKISWGILILLQPLIASFATYFYARKISIGKIGSLMASIAYGYCLFQSVFLEYNTIGHIIALMPLGLLGLELIRSNKKLLGILLFITSLVFGSFAGHIQIWGFVSLFLFVYSIFLMKNVKHKIKFSISVGFLFIIGFFISSIQLIPTLELIANSARIAQNYNFLIQNLLIQPNQLFLLFIPDLFGNPATRNYLLSDSYPGNAMYIGVLPFIFAIYSLVKVKSNKYILFFSCVALVLVVFLLRSPFTEVFYHLNIPLFSTGSPSNVLFLLSFSLAILSGFGFDYFLEKYDKKIFIILFSVLFLSPLIILESKMFSFQINNKNFLFSLGLLIIGIIIIFLAKVFKNKRKIISLIMITFTIFDLFYFFNKFNPFVNPQLLYPNTSVISEVQKLAGENRVWSYGDANIEPNVLSIFGIEDPNGYDPLYPKSYGEFISSSNDGSIHTNFDNNSRSDATVAPAFSFHDLDSNKYRMKILNALSVGYIVSKEFLPNEFLEKYNWKLVWGKDNWFIYQNLSSIPHAYLVGKAIPYVSAKDFSNKFFSDGFELDKSVLLENKNNIAGGTNGSVKIVNYSPEKVEIITETNGRQILVLTDTYFPGWIVTVDGVEKPILKANYTLRGVEIPEGQHKVIFSYRPLSFYIGLALTIIGLMGLGAYFVFIKRFKTYYD
ncbi:MAG TPA: YfhO family protein [Patescibacteria group bacterium]